MIHTLLYLLRWVPSVMKLMNGLVTRCGDVTCDRPRGGFTLVEVLLAVVIMSVGLTVLLTATARCLGVMKKAQNYQVALWTLNMGEAEHPIMATNDIKDIDVDSVEYPNGFTYSRKVEEDTDEDGLYAVRSRASWSEKGSESYEEVVGYIFHPEDKDKK